MSRRVTSPIIVGRDAELAELIAALDAAATGAGGLLLVEGEAGIGKTRLIGEFVARATERGALALAGSCLPFADAVPYAPLAAILDQLPDGGRAATGPAGVEPADRFRFFRWVADELIKLAAPQPLIVSVEDLHWADESTGDLLLFVANAVRTAPVLVVASRRPPERDHPTGLGAALGELVRSGRAQRLSVGPLGRDDVGAMIGQILGVDPSPGLLDRVVGRSDGNPFFTEELVAAGGGDELPTMVGDVIRQRVARLDVATQQLLRVAAVIGRRVSHVLLNEVAEIDRPSLDAAVRDAVGHQLLVATGDHYSFRHALGHEAVYRDVLPGERAALHERIATALTERPELALDGDHAVAAAELAHHWHAAGRLPKSLAASVRAGQAAESADAPIEAHVHYRRAIELWPRVDDAAASTGVDRTWLLEHAAETSSLAGSHHGAVQFVDQLLAEIDPEREPERHARILVRRTLFLWYAGDAATSKQATAELRERAEAGLTLAAVTRLCAVANQSSLELRYVDALTLARDAMGAARQVGAQADVGFALHILGSLESHLGCYDAAIEHLQQALAIALEHADSQRIGSTWHNLAEAYVYAGRSAEAVIVAERGIAELQRLGLSRTFAALTAGQLTFALLDLGRWAEAEQCSRNVIAGEAQPYFAVPVKLGRLDLLVRQGRFDDVEALLSDLRGDFGGYEYMAGVCALWDAELAVWQHDWQRARSSLERADAVTAATDEIGLELRLAPLAVRLEADEYAWARLTAAPRDQEAARASADARIRQAEEFLVRIETVTGCCSLPFRRQLELAYAERGRLDDSLVPVRWAGIASRAEHHVYLAAYAQWREADTILAATARPDRARAQTLVRSAYARATALGAAPLAAAVADLAMRARIELAIPIPDAGIEDEATDLDAHGLTRRELEVLRLLGDGLSNREIGEALFISAKTASVHVTHILQKLNVTTRVQAALAADRLTGQLAADSPLESII